MSRRIRLGLDYFPLDTSWDLNIRLLKVQFGLEGLGAIIQLQQMIFKEGYALAWLEETKHLFCFENGIEQSRLDVILEFCLEHELFDRDLLERRSILSSKEIQRQWIKISIDAKRKIFTIDPDLSLCPEDETQPGYSHERGKAREESENTPESSGNPREFSGKTWKPSKESKVKKNKEDKKDLPELFGAASITEQQIHALIDDLTGAKKVSINDDTDAKASLTQRFQRLIQRSGQG